MKSNQVLVLQVLLVFIAAFHLIVGVGLNVSSQFPSAVAAYYGAQVDFSPALLYLVKPIGAFMIALGFMAAAAVRDPLRHRAIAYGFVVLFVLRGLQRIVFQQEIETAVNIAASRNIANAIFFFLLAAAVFVLFQLAQKKAESA